MFFKEGNIQIFVHLIHLFKHSFVRDIWVPSLCQVYSSKYRGPQGEQIKPETCLRVYSLMRKTEIEQVVPE